jgi:hypothetical protein
METFKDQYSVAIIRPRITSRLARAANELEPWELAQGLRIEQWMKRFRRNTERIANMYGQNIDMTEYQVHARRSVVPNYQERKRIRHADLIAVVDPDHLFFEFLETESMKHNPMVSAIIGQLAVNRDEIREMIAQLPEIPLIGFDERNEMRTAERVMTDELHDPRLLPNLIRRAMVI